MVYNNFFSIHISVTFNKYVFPLLLFACYTITISLPWCLVAVLCIYVCRHACEFFWQCQLFVLVLYVIATLLR